MLYQEEPKNTSIYSRENNKRVIAAYYFGQIQENHIL